MIVELLLDAIEALLSWLASMFPSGAGLSLPMDGFGGFLSHVADLNYYLPIGEVFTFTIGALIVFPALAGVSLLVWLVALIRGGSARG